MFEKGDIMETIRNVDVNRLHDFKNHPFKVEMNTELCELMRSIEKEGVLVPLLVRTNPYGDGYNVMGRIDYITSTVKQENLYAIYATQPLRSFWKDLAKCNIEEFAKSGTIGKYIEARELIIALPEGLYHYEHDYLIKHFATDFKKSLQNIYDELQKQNEAIFAQEHKRSELEIELSECNGAFKARKRGGLQNQIYELNKQIDNMKRYLSSIVQRHGYDNVRDFYSTYYAAKGEYADYVKDVEEWNVNHVKKNENIQTEENRTDRYQIGEERNFMRDKDKEYLIKKR